MTEAETIHPAVTCSKLTEILATIFERSATSNVRDDVPDDKMHDDKITGGQVMTASS